MSLVKFKDAQKKKKQCIALNKFLIVVTFDSEKMKKKI